ncbi:glycoside hydrolase family 3 C-terminal domain-containing protein [Microbacterium sp. NPDC088619]|uniref:glycoside hydrolase family 3 C-terminal domain-containing protein n=1 Tax=Microbacterium sp. NPDC088619 TaxID=3364196 RepID=UPI003808301F
MTDVNPYFHAELSLEQAASLTSGADFWSTKSVGSVPSIVLTDGPHGLRKQEMTIGGDHLGIGVSVPATCFPPAVGLSQSWNPELIARVGAALGVECQTEKVGVLLGPGINIKRDPRGGRNFEYYSEDPLISGELGAAWVRGVQSEGVGASLKHFAANNSENDRMRASSNIDDRTLREIYLRAFQRVVTDAQPWTVMCSYNRLNGLHTAQHEWLLTTLLRDEWGFDGAVVSDWGAVTDRVASLVAGLDLTMPGPGESGDAEIVAAVRSGIVDRSVVDRAAARVADLASKAGSAHRESSTFDRDRHHALAREAAAGGIVLLKNEGDLLPLGSGVATLAVIGDFATNPRYQGGGSSMVNATRVDVPLDEISARAGDAQVRFAQGFTTEGPGDEDALRAEAVHAAAEADVAVLFLGLGARQESEGFDRDGIELPADQLRLLSAVAEVRPQTVVVLSHGGVVLLNEVIARVPAILDGALLGQGGGAAIADALFGLVNPSGRLAETVPLRLEDVPSFLAFEPENSEVGYGEGLFVGYRWYDARGLDVAFPFGHGLSYTTFEYSQLTLVATEAGLMARLTVTNTGERAGREVVQFYVGMPATSMKRAPRELKGFASVELAPGESSVVETVLRREDLAYWETRLDRWIVESGDYRVDAGASSRDLRLSASVRVDGDPIRIPLHRESTLAEVMANPVGAARLGGALQQIFGGSPDRTADLGFDVMRMIGSSPVARFAAGLGGQITPEQLDEILAEANADRGE